MTSLTQVRTCNCNCISDHLAYILTHLSAKTLKSRILLFFLFFYVLVIQQSSKHSSVRITNGSQRRGMLSLNQ